MNLHAQLLPRSLGLSLSASLHHLLLKNLFIELFYPMGAL